MMEKMTKMKPIGDNILIKPLPLPNVTEGGLFIPDSAKKISNKCEVIAVGAGSNKKPMQIKKGQIVFRVKDWGMPIEDNGINYFVINQDAVLATN